MKLEFKHVAAYLPYGLKLKYIGGLDDEDNRTDESSHVKIGVIGDLVGIDNQYRNPIYWISTLNGHVGLCSNDIKPILRPLSDLKKEIEVDGEKFIPKNRLRDLIMIRGNYSKYDSNWINENIDPFLLPFWMIEYLLEWHFDIYGLLENNLAIDINTSNQIK
jgi:hypothetical protein